MSTINSTSALQVEVLDTPLRPLLQTASTATELSEWSLSRRVAFRFAFAYFLIYFLPSPFFRIPGANIVSGGYDKLSRSLVLWVGKHILHVSPEIVWVSNGSGDQTYSYVRLLTVVVIAALVTVIWSIVDRRRKQYDLMFSLLRVYVRYVLAFTMFGYGFLKVFKGQFSHPGPSRLTETYGDSSPMGLLWTFMGYSTAYTMFAGWLEVIGGALLIFRRTTLAGALWLIAVVGNIVMLNFCYDVPVKLLSLNLLLMAIFLVIPDVPRLANLFLLNRAAPPVTLRMPLRSPPLKYGLIGLKALFVGFVLFTNLKRPIDQQRVIRGAQKSPLAAFSGWYEVEEFVGGQQPWRRFGLTQENFIVRAMDHSQDWYRIEHDPKNKTMTLSSEFTKVERKYVLDYERPSENYLVLTGQWDNDRIKVRARKIEARDTLLMTRGFHWINEVPFNR